MVSRPSSFPLLGAQVWAEPHNTPEQIDLWLRTLAEHHMPVARIWIFWSHVEPQRDEWDFALYDAIFESAKKFNIRLVPTLTPGTGPAHHGCLPLIQNDVIPKTEAEADLAIRYIEKVVPRYANHPALDTWIILNEPGFKPHVDERSLAGFRKWLQARYRTIDALNKEWHAAFASWDCVTYDEAQASANWGWPATFIDWLEFWRFYLAQQLGTWAEVIRRHDPIHPLHVNPHGLISNLAGIGDDLPAWRAFLDSLGASIHPAWHFWMLRRNQYALGVSYVCDLIRGAAGPLPFWVTELQGGNNIYTAVRPMCPDARDIAQWVWTGIGSGAERVIFWLLNMREHSWEGGEWSMLDFQQRPTERLKTAGAIGRKVEEHAEFFEGARALASSITIILSLETMTLQEKLRTGDSPGRDRNAHIFEALGFYEALQELGVPVEIKHIHDFAWEESGDEPRFVILPHAWALTPEQTARINLFVENGNTLLASGLTGFHDDRGRLMPVADFPLAKTLGGNFKEVRFLKDPASITLSNPTVTLPVHQSVGDIDRYSGETLGEQDGRILALKNRAGRGESIWIPSFIGLGAWLGDRAPLAALLSHLISSRIGSVPFRFEQYQPGLVLRVMQNGGSYLTVLTNGTDGPAGCELALPHGMAGTVIWGREESLAGKSIRLDGRDTLVILWRAVR